MLLRVTEPLSSLPSAVHELERLWPSPVAGATWVSSANPQALIQTQWVVRRWIHNPYGVNSRKRHRRISRKNVLLPFQGVTQNLIEISFGNCDLRSWPYKWLSLFLLPWRSRNMKKISLGRPTKKWTWLQSHAKFRGNRGLEPFTPLLCSFLHTNTFVCFKQTWIEFLKLCRRKYLLS